MASFWLWFIIFLITWISTIDLVRILSIFIGLIGILLIGLFIFCQWKLWKKANLSAFKTVIGILLMIGGIVLIYFSFHHLKLKHTMVFMIYGILFLITHWITMFVKRHQADQAKKILKQITWSCSLAVLSLSIFTGIVFGASKYFSIFDPERWVHKENRIHMVDHLTTRYQLKGMTQAEVMDLLGKPDRVIKRKKHIIVYDLGFEPMRIDPSTLDIWLDSKGRVIKYQITNH